MEANKIVPDIIDKAPLHLAEVIFPTGVKALEGNELAPMQVRDAPAVTYPAEPRSYYTLLFTDPDAPSRDKADLREVRHWAVVNIPGNDVSAGETLVEYVGSGPPEGTGLHRYVFLVFKQPGKLTFDETYVSDTNSDGRLKTNTRKFVEHYKLGDPVAGNFYLAQFDDYVPIVLAQFK